MNYFSSNSVLIQDGLPIKRKHVLFVIKSWGKRASLDRGVHMFDGNAAETTASTTGNLPLEDGRRYTFEMLARLFGGRIYSGAHDQNRRCHCNRHRGITNCCSRARPGQY